MKRPRHWLAGLLCLGVLSGCSPDLAELRPNDQGLRYLHPYPQPRPGRSPQWTSLDGSTTYVSTAPGLFPNSNPYDDPPGTNFINNVNSNMFDGFGREMPNTLPSTPERPYNLIDGDVITSRIARRSPTTDLHSILRRAGTAATRGQIDRAALQEAVDIIEGNAVFPDRTYDGFPLLHYNGPNKVKQVEPIYSDSGELVGGAVNIHQIWYDSHIESDTAFIDPSKVFDAPWTVTYTIDVLEGGSDDFSPFVIYVDDPFLSPRERRRVRW